jgi:hypothetical protein
MIEEHLSWRFAKKLFKGLTQRYSFRCRRVCSSLPLSDLKLSVCLVMSAAHAMCVTRANAYVDRLGHPTILFSICIMRYVSAIWGHGGSDFCRCRWWIRYGSTGKTRGERICSPTALCLIWM